VAAAEALHSQRRRVTRKALADVLRADGYGVSNARASALLRELKSELDGRMSPSGLPGVSASAHRSSTQIMDDKGLEVPISEARVRDSQ
jgi:ribosomal protein L12E/L44/L45/RPP1/RPP2